MSLGEDLRHGLAAMIYAIGVAVDPEPMEDDEEIPWVDDFLVVPVNEVDLYLGRQRLLMRMELPTSTDEGRQLMMARIADAIHEAMADMGFHAPEPAPFSQQAKDIPWIEDDPT